MAILETNQMMFTAFEPKLQNRFLLDIHGIPAYLIRTTGRPSVTFGEVVLDHINVKRKLKGKANWENITMDLYDPVTPSGAQAVMEWVRLSHESVTGRDGYSDFYKKDLTIDVLGPVGDVVSEWIIKGAFIKDGSFADMNWDTDNEAQTIDLTIGMDYCVLNF